MKKSVVYKVIASEFPKFFNKGDLICVEDFVMKYTKYDGKSVLNTAKSTFSIRNNTTGRIIHDVSDGVYVTEDLYE